MNLNNKQWHNALENYIMATNTHHFEEVRKCLSHQAKYFFSDKTCANLTEIQNYFETSWSVIKDERYSIDNIE